MAVQDVFMHVHVHVHLRLIQISDRPLPRIRLFSQNVNEEKTAGCMLHEQNILQHKIKINQTFIT